MIYRVHHELTEENIFKVADIRQHSYILTPDRYVGTAEVEDDAADLSIFTADCGKNRLPGKSAAACGTIRAILNTKAACFTIWRIDPLGNSVVSSHRVDGED